MSARVTGPALASNEAVKWVKSFFFVAHIGSLSKKPEIFKLQTSSFGGLLIFFLNQPFFVYLHIQSYSFALQLWWCCISVICFTTWSMYIDLGTAVNLALKEGRKSHDVLFATTGGSCKRDTLYREYSSLFLLKHMFLWKNKYYKLEIPCDICHPSDSIQIWEQFPSSRAKNPTTIPKD